MVAYLLRGTAQVGVAGLFLLGASEALQTAAAEGDTRTISFHHLHTGEDITITYKRNGRYDDAALKKLDWFMRDWRREQTTHMDPHLIDLLWETYREVGGNEPIEVVCGYRSPETNAMLRARSTGVAQFSQHTQGQAMDFYIPRVPLEKIRVVGLRLQRGGVGFYPTSGSPFVHLDTGSVRHWPRMTHEQLARVFPDGRTVHIPSDGQPLPGYALALADVESRGTSPSAMSLEAAREAGVLTASAEHATKPMRSLFARIFGTRAADDEPREEQTPVVAPKHARAPTTVASIAAPNRVAVERIVPLPTARPKPVQVAAVAPVKPKIEKIVIASASVPSSLFDKRGYWRGTVETSKLSPVAPSTLETASVDVNATSGAASTALAYAAESHTPTPVLVHPMGSNMRELPVTAALIPASSNATTVSKAPLTPAMAQISRRAADPWLRAVMLTPSVSNTMTTTQIGPVDPRPLVELLHKPVQSVVMSFSADPHFDMVADSFSGRAVVFLATATFGPTTTASATLNGTATASLR